MKISDGQLDMVAGGNADSCDVKTPLADQFPPKIKVKCVDCGKEIEVVDDSKLILAMIGSEMARRSYYKKRCKECAIKKPYPGDKYDSQKDIFVKSNLEEFLKPVDPGLGS